MVTTIPHRELRNNSSDILRRVQSGETFEITNHGKVVAVLASPDPLARHRLTSRPALVVGGFSQLASVEIDHPIQETLDALRGDR